MSTAGKVLIGFIIFTALLWVVFASAVTNRNKDWEQKIQKLDEQIAGKKDERDLRTGGLIGQIADLELKVRGLTHQFALLQAQGAKDLAVIRTELSDLEKMESFTKERLLRLQLEVANVQATEKSTGESLALRKKEKADTEQAIIAAQMNVEQLKASVGEQFAELEKLRTEFRETLADNQRRIEQARKRAGAAASGAVDSR
jgi:chromosome segregation ATPase